MVQGAKINVMKEAAQAHNVAGTVEAAFSLATSQMTCMQTELAYNVTL